MNLFAVILNRMSKCVVVQSRYIQVYGHGRVLSMEHLHTGHRSSFLKDSNSIEIFYCFSTSVVSLILFSFLSANSIVSYLLKDYYTYSLQTSHTSRPLSHLLQDFFFSRSGLPVGIWSALCFFSFSFISLKLIIRSSSLIHLLVDLH